MADSLIVKCREHVAGKTCVEIMVDGNCLKEKCRLYPKVLRMLPKLEKYYRLKAQGVILSTIWDFSEENMAKMERQKKKAEQWLKTVLPKIKMGG